MSQDNIKSPRQPVDGVFRFGDFMLNADRLILYIRGVPLALAPKVVETLAALVERAGEVISKDDLMQRLWPDSFVEESNLTQNIYVLRKTLGCRPDGRNLIETFRRRGYRFSGELEYDETAVESTLASDVRSGSADFDIVAGFDSLAVLPFSSGDGGEAAGYLSDGITESTINRLCQLGGLRVVGRNTAFQFKERAAEPISIGRELKVKAVLTGRVLEMGQRLIVRTELVDTRSGFQIWGEQFDRPADDLLDLQETIAMQISDNLRLRLTGNERRQIIKRHTDSVDAYHLFIKGRYHLNKRLIPAIKLAADYFAQAVATDPNYALAYVGIADCFPLLTLYGSLTPDEAYAKARAAAERALAIDGELAEAHNSLGVVKLFYDWDWRGAESCFRRAIELGAGYPDACQRLGMLLTALGRFSEASAELDRAVSLDPLSLITKTIAAYPFYYGRDFDEAARRFSEVIAIDDGYSMAHFRLGLTLAQMGRFDAAIAELKKANTLSGDRDTVGALGRVYSMAGNTREALKALGALAALEDDGFVSAYNRAIICAALGETEASLDYLEKAYRERSYWLVYLKNDPALDPLRGEQRFTALEQIMFPPSATG